jgi:hypothetical protein
VLFIFYPGCFAKMLVICSKNSHVSSMLFLTESMAATMKSHLHQILEEVSAKNEITFAPNFGGGKRQQ